MIAWSYAEFALAKAALACAKAPVDNNAVLAVSKAALACAEIAAVPGAPGIVKSVAPVTTSLPAVF